ncbi:cytochrome b-c1 complex subunit 7 [Lasioglossum baleicum]|uniref:cytochrome b-c1 complex subunit 7 n=1 Tax=Lasioglossum baleicum TaxID=434251 RepID=UPI003FCCDBA2
MSRLSTIIKTSRGIFNRGMKPSGERGINPKWSKIAFNLSGFNQFGLYSQDLIHEGYPIIQSALRRLPVDVLDARTFRIIRAVQLDYLESRLPKNEWITYEEDLEYRYLDPYLKEIAAERNEIYEFGCVNYSEKDWPADEL